MIFSASRYHDVNVPNLWNPVGNPWKRDDSIFVHCYDVIYSTQRRHHHHHRNAHCPHSIHDHHHLCPLPGCNQHLVIIIVLIITVLIWSWPMSMMMVLRAGGGLARVWLQYVQPIVIHIIMMVIILILIMTIAISIVDGFNTRRRCGRSLTAIARDWTYRALQGCRSIIQVLYI